METTLYDLLIQDARFLYGAETEQASRLRELSEAVSDEELRTLFLEHAEETEAQIGRLEMILRDAGEDPQAEIPAAVDGLIEDAEFIAQQDLGPLRDVALAVAARKMEHYEIACYGSALTVAEQLGLEEIVNPLRETLEEERRADQRIAEVSMRLVQTQVPQETEAVGATEED